MTYLEQIQRAIDYIEGHLDEDIDVALIAQEAGLSRWHFQRIFKALTSETVKTYIRSRRMAQALDKLLTTDDRVLDIAIAAGYESQASFTRTFKATFGFNPAEYRRLGDNSLFLKKVRIDTAYLRHLSTGVSLEPQIATRKSTAMVGLRTVFYGIDSEKNNVPDLLPDLWATFLQHMAEIPNMVGEEAYGIIRQLADGSDQLEYHACVEVSGESPTPDGMQRFTVPQATYATFQHRGHATELDNTVNYIYANWLLGSDLRHNGGVDIEIYGPDYDPTSSDSVVGYAIPLANGDAVEALR